MEMINEKTVEEAFSRASDLKKRQILSKNAVHTVYYLDGFVDQALLSRFLIAPLGKIDNVPAAVRQGEIAVCQAEEATKEQVIDGILRGKAALIENGCAWLFDVRKTEKRSVEQPGEESAVKASKDSFVEELKTNLTLLRKKIVSPHLAVEMSELGRQSHTAVALVYMENIANDGILREVRERLKTIDVDGVITSGVIQQAFAGSKRSLFPQVLVTERPDKIAQSLLNGRFAVFADGLPLGFLVPATLAEFMNTPEDYAQNYVFASTVRLLRYFLLGLEVLLPGTYVALTTFHFEMLPSKLALSIAEAKAGVPFPVLFEVLTMLALFEVLVEAGLHMPQSSGQAVSIVGALVVGEAAINADLVSPAALIVVAVSAVSSFAMPNQEFSNALRLWRILLTLAGGALGLFGVTAGALAMLLQLAGMESLQVPYLAPLAGVKKIRLKDTLVVVPDRDNVFRPEELKVKNRRRAK